MPGWITYTDPDGNSYYIDKNAKIWVSGEPDSGFQAVSLQGIEYYTEQGEALIRNHHKVEGLTLLKAVRVLADKKEQAYRSGVKAAKLINQLAKQEGDRYRALDDAASLMLVDLGDNVYVYNDRMRYGLTVTGSVKVIKKKIRYQHKYLRYGVMLGITFTPQTMSKNTRFDVVMLINSEEFDYKLPNVLMYESMCAQKLPDDTFIRKKIQQDRYGLEYFFADNSATASFQGYEAFFVKNRKGYFLRIIGDDKTIRLYQDNVLRLLRSFKYH